MKIREKMRFEDLKEGFYINEKRAKGTTFIEGGVPLCYVHQSRDEWVVAYVGGSHSIIRSQKESVDDNVGLDPRFLEPVDPDEYIKEFTSNISSFVTTMRNRAKESKLAHVPKYSPGPPPLHTEFT